MPPPHPIRHSLARASLHFALGAGLALAAPPAGLSALLVRAAAPADAAPPLAAPRPPALPIVLRRNADGLFYLTAAINGRPTRLVVDTGASVVVLSAEDAARAGVVGHVAAEGIVTANGAVTMQWARAGSIRVGAQDFADVPVTVAPQSSVSLIGESLIARFASVTIAGDTMVLR